MTTSALRLTGVLLLLCALPSLGDELDLLGRHELEGRIGGKAFSGWLELRADASFTGERRFADGTVEALAGRAAIDRKDLVLTPESGGLRGAVLGEPAPAVRRYARQDEGRVVRWRFSAGADEELIRQPGKDETRLGYFGRLAKRPRPVLCWLFNDNRAVVDTTKDLEIHRSKQPTPNDIEDMIRTRGVRTVLSLNGDLDEKATRWIPGEPLEGAAVARAEHVNLRAFIAAQGLNHETVSMGASRAPSDAELVAVFRVLLDDTKKPILMHCRGGSDRTGVITALYEIEFLGVSKADAKEHMRTHLWMAARGTEVQGAYLDLYQEGTLRRLLEAHGVEIPARYR